MSTATKRIGAVAAAAVLVIAAIWYLALYQPQSKKLAKAHAAQAAALTQIANLNSQAAHLQALERQIPADTGKLAGLKANVPDTPDLAGALLQLHQAATTSGVTLTNVAPTAPVAASTQGSNSPKPTGPPFISLSMTASGSYAQLMSFMTSLETMTRTVVVDHVAITSGQQQNSLNASIGARIFYAGQSTP